MLKEALGPISSYVGVFAATSLIFPGSFTENLVSSAAFEASRYGIKKLGASSWKQYAGAFGASLLVSSFAGNRFSGSDDAYNTIEGFSENTLAAEQRHRLTDFGSGFIGLAKTYLVGEKQTLGIKETKKFLLDKDEKNYLVDKRRTFSGQDDNYNTIEGLRHTGGLAELKRVAITDFGSGWDPLKTMAKNLFKGEKDSFSKMLKSSSFQEALRSGKTVRALGQGRYGSASLMESSFMGQNFQYVKKNIEGISSPFLEDVPKAQKIQALQKEASILSEVSEGIAPTPYGYNKDKNELFMELMPGKPVEDLRSELPLSAIKTMESEIENISAKNIFNPDIHAGNIMFEESTNKVSWIDWGLAKREQNPNVLQMKEALKEKVTTPNKAASSRQRLGKDSGFFNDWGDLNASLSPVSKSLEQKQALKRTNRFNKVSTEAVGIGFRAAHKAGRKHTRFSSLG